MRLRRRALLAALGLSAALGLTMTGAAPISADTPVTHTGLYGVHYLADSAEYPSTTCFYDNGSTIHSVRVRAPFVYARNTSPGIETQAVSWQVVVQARTTGSSTFATVTTSPAQKRSTTDARAADFVPMTTVFAGNGGKEYRILVVVRWYGSGGATEVGRATHRADWYAWSGVPSFHGLCPGGVF
jgi:hypothetical protein